MNPRSRAGPSASIFFGTDDPRATAWRSGVGTELFVAPPALPALVAAANRVAGEEAPWVSRLYTTAFWLLAAFAIRRIIDRSTGSEWGGVAGFAWFALCPFGQILSLSFQTESLLALAFAIAIGRIGLFGTRLTWRRTVWSGVACGAVAFVKPGMLVFPLVLAFATTILPRSVPATRWRKLLHLILFGTFVAAPGVLYAAAFLRSHSGRIMPQLLLEPWFYSGLAFQLREAIGLPMLAAGAAGLVIAARAGRPWLPALAVGHTLTLAVFTYHAATHDYYQLPLMVVTAIALGETVAFVERRIGRRPAAVLALVAATSLVWRPEPFIGPWRWLPENGEQLQSARMERERRAARSEAAGRIVGPNDRTIELTEVYGYPLRYHGWVQTARWPSIEERGYMRLAGAIPEHFDAAAYLQQLIGDTNARWFIVTDLAEWKRQPDLQSALSRFGPPDASVEGALIFDLRRGPR
jgi:hypothetical protein